MIKYVEGNINFLREYLKRELPQLQMIEPEGTYLVWLDFRKLGLEGKELEKLVVEDANLWLDSGDMFGQVGEGFERINVACPRSILKQALEQLKAAVLKYNSRS
jgi:cystathionine beta-lyase